MVASPSPNRKSSACSERLRLEGAFLQATRDLQGLHDNEITELLNRVIGPGRGRYDLAIKLARKRLDSARRAYLLHLQMHGC